MAGQAVIEDYFVCVGAQKAGTTWLARVLAQHPEIFLTPVKEIHYFDHIAGLTRHLSDRKRRSRYRKYHQRLWTQWRRWRELRAQGDWYRTYMRDPIDDAWYAALFADRGGRRLAGEATPEYALIGRDGFRHLRRLAPDARLLYVMRDPVTRAWSQILHQCRSEGRDAARMTTPELIAMTGSERFEALSDYARTIDDIRGVFPAERIWLGFYEDIHADRAAALAGICRFVGADFDPAWFRDLSRRYNISQAVGMPAEVRSALGERYRKLVRAVEERVGRVPDAWTADATSEAPKRKSPART